jgi:hypothetical protein
LLLSKPTVSVIVIRRLRPLKHMIRWDRVGFANATDPDRQAVCSIVSQVS